MCEQPAEYSLVGPSPEDDEPTLAETRERRAYKLVRDWAGCEPVDQRLLEQIAAERTKAAPPRA